ncbi:MAG: Cys-tRNA(Pro) deacylase, partial [Oscillospiraceae bacterium]|nr:Cys-tRNA(Pro) deacylase [Oscillospiraceae bacterium]
KKAARAANDKNVEMIHVKELLPLTGYIRGGCSPVGMKKAYPVFIEESAVLYDSIGISAGERGVQMMVAPDDLVAFLGAELADITVY